MISGAVDKLIREQNMKAEVDDTIKFHEEGWIERYYSTKFEDPSMTDKEYRFFL